MNLLDRIIKTSRRNVYGTKKLPFIWPDWRGGTPQWHIVDLQSYINEGFNLNTLIYSAIMYKVRAIGQAPLRAYTGDFKHPEVLPPDHPMTMLAARPNEHQSFKEFQGQNIVYLNLAGNCYIFLDYEKITDKMPRAMYSLRPDRTYVIPDKGKPGIKGYLYVPEGTAVRDGVPILPQHMIHTKFPNPGDPLEGMGEGLSPMSPLARSADVDNSVTHFLKLFFEKGVMMPGLLSFPEPLDDTTIAETRQRWKDIYGGYLNWAEEIGMVGRGATYQRIGLSFEEMGFGELDTRNETRILGPFGVPPILIGAKAGLESSTYSNYGQARKACWEDTLVPELGLYEVDFQYYLKHPDGWVAFDTSKVPALQKDIPTLVTAAHQMWTMGVPANQAFYTVGLNVEPVPGGDIGYLPMAIIPTGTEPGGTPVMPEPPVRPVDQEEMRRKKVPGPSGAWKLRFWKAFDVQAKNWEGAFGLAADSQFEVDKRGVLAALHRGKARAIQDKATINWSRVEEDVYNYLRNAGEGWRSTFVPLYQGLIEDRAQVLTEQFGMSFDVRNWLAEAFLTDPEFVIPFAEQPLIDTTQEHVKQLLQAAQENGWGIDETSNNLEKLFNQYVVGDGRPEDFWFLERMPPHRREYIARTETIRASNYGSFETYKAWGAEGKEWLSTPDNRTRDTHVEVNGQKRKIDEPFDVGGEKLMYPADPAGSAKEVLQCRCTTLPVLKMEEPSFDRAVEQLDAYNWKVGEDTYVEMLKKSDPRWDRGKLNARQIGLIRVGDQETLILADGVWEGGKLIDVSAKQRNSLIEEAVIPWLQKIPGEHVQGLHRVVFTNNVSGMASGDYHSIALKYRTGVMENAAGWINIHGWQEYYEHGGVANIVSTLKHELGHHVWDYVLSDADRIRYANGLGIPTSDPHALGYQYENFDTLRLVYETEVGKDIPMISYYGQTNVFEDFAELYKGYSSIAGEMDNSINYESYSSLRILFDPYTQQAVDLRMALLRGDIWP